MKSTPTQKATFAAGCFWGVQNLFDQIDGVVSTRVGYIGGHTQNPTYQEVCTDQTGHAEAVEIIFDPAKVSYQQLLTVFWENHDPTALNRQGPDVGAQYRSEIFYHGPEQAQIAHASKQALEQSGQFNQPIVTRITPAADFYPAEEYHQKYFEKNNIQSCSIKSYKKSPG